MTDKNVIEKKIGDKVQPVKTKHRSRSMKNKKGTGNEAKNSDIPAPFGLATIKDKDDKPKKVKTYYNNRFCYNKRFMKHKKTTNSKYAEPIKSKYKIGTFEKNRNDRNSTNRSKREDESTSKNRNKEIKSKIFDHNLTNVKENNVALSDNEHRFLICKKFPKWFF